MKTTKHFRCFGSLASASARPPSKMAEEVQNTGDSKLLVEKDESEGPILKFSLGEMI